MATKTLPENANRFYVYVIFDLSGTPRYVGKGCARRMYEHSYRACNTGLRKLYKEHDRNVPIVKIREGLCETEAFLIEGGLIAAIGRIDRASGPLFNHTDGGDGYAGHTLSETARHLISVAKNGQKRSAETCRRISLAKKGTPRPKPAIEAQRAKMIGRKHSEETRLKISQSLKGKNHNSPERRVKMKDSALGNMWAKHKISAADSTVIRKRYSSGERSSELAVEFGLSQGQIQRIVSGKRWTRTIIDSTCRC